MRISELVEHLAKECAWELGNLGFRSAQRVVWVFSGTYWQLYQSRQPLNYERSAQVMKIIARHKMDEYLSPAKGSDFITTHVLFDTPERVLKDNTTLYSVNEREAFFVETVCDDLWRSRWSPFFLYAQYRHATHVIRMPIESFHRLADKVGDPKNLTFIANTARCGSTMLTQMFEATGKVVSISEPSALNILSLMASKPGCDQAKLNRIISSTVRMLCKPTTLGESGYVLKFTGPAMLRIPNIVRVFPAARCLFMYRDPVKTIHSLSKLGEELPLLKLLLTVGRKSAWRLEHLMNSQGMPGSHYRVNFQHSLTLCFVQIALVQHYYREFRQQGLPIVGVSYEDVVADPAAAMRRVLLFCGLAQHGISLTEDECRQALKGDSQKGTPLSSAVLSRHPTLDIEVARSECDAYADSLGMPRLGVQYVPPGTITSSDDTAEEEARRFDSVSVSGDDHRVSRSTSDETSATSTTVTRREGYATD